MKKIDRRSFLRQAGVATAALATGLNTSLYGAESTAETQGEAAARTPQPLPAAKRRGKLFELQPTDHGGALVNPNMGWTMHFYSNLYENYGSFLEPSDTLEDFPGLNGAYLRLPWIFLEPEEGRYQWEVLDTPAQRWIDRGMQVSLRITAMENWTPQATPQWVFDAGARSYRIDNGRMIEPDYDDPVFLEKVENFVRAMAERYDGNPNVAFVDIGHYGMWGEGHTVPTSKLHGKEWGIETQKKHIDLYCRHFKKTQLCMSDDYAGSFLRGERFPITDYAFSKGVAFRDDSILVFKKPDQWYHAEVAQQFWPTMPVILEHQHYGLSKAGDEWDSELLVESVEAHHASFMSIHWWPREELAECREAIERINRRMGYRLRMPSVSWPAEIALGEPFEIASQWCNAGVAPCYQGGYPCFTLKDDKGGIVSVTVDESLDVKTLTTGAPEQAPLSSLKTRCNIAPRFTDALGNVFARSCDPGTYTLYVSVGKRDGTPLYELPYGSHDGKRRYALGKITLTGENIGKKKPEDLSINAEVTRILNRKK